MIDASKTEVGEDAMAVVVAQAHEVARGFTTLWMPSQVVCPSEIAEEAVVRALSTAALQRDVPFETIDLRPAPAERLEAVTARLAGWRGRPETRDPTFVRSLLILRGFDVFGDEQHEEPTYPFRSNFQFDEEFRWVFLGRNDERMRFLFSSYERPLYLAAMDITPEAWR
ncbi:hypothetical protein [Luteimonas qiangzhengi]|uniref:hypothetical protein n=1 Tax=Luteimonas sp. MJ146 TaxID=3129240 RepID=UPI0031BB5B56